MPFAWYRIRSTALKQVGYDSERQTLLIQWESGAWESFGAVPAYEIYNLGNAPSPRDYLLKTITPQYQRIPLEPFDPIIVPPGK